MVEKLSAQQNVQLNDYLKQHPKTSRDAAIKLLFGNKERSSTSSTGLAVEHNTKDAYEFKTIYLQSGRKVVYTKTKNGKFVYKYYGADGNLIKPEYFKKVEGNISINEAENSYTTTKNGKSIKHKAKDPRKAQIDQNIAKLNKQEKYLKRAKKEQGFIGKRWDWFKNTAAGEFFNLDGSDKAQKQIDEERKLLTQLRDNPNAQIDPKKFEKITGQKYTKANLTKFQHGEFSSAKAMVDGYKEGQAIAVDVASDVTSGIVSFGIYAVAIAAAPVTGGASIAIGLAAAGVAGAATKIAVKAADTIGTNRKYDLLSKEAAGDALMGSVNGLLAPFTAGAVAKTVAIRAGVQIVKETGKQATKQVLSQATKNAAKQGLGRVFKSQLKESIIHPNNYKLVGGTFGKRLAAYGAEGVVDGALSGGAYSGVETARDGGSAGDILKATALGFGTGAIMGGVMSSAAHGKGIVTGNKGAGEVLEDGVANAAEKTTTKGSTPKAQADAIENSVTKNTNSSLAPSGRGLGRGADDATPTLKPQAVSRDELKASLQNGKIVVKSDAYADSHINIPTVKLAANGAKFLETDEAFKQILTNNKYDVLLMHQKYKITGDLDGFVKDMYSHYVKETDIGQFAPELNIKSNTGTEAGSFNHENNSLMISKDYINKESDVAHNVAHELNHWFQNKEMLITTSEGPELVAYNRVLGNLKEMVKNGDITSQADFDRYLREWSVEDAAKLRITYQDLLNSTKYPHNNDPASPYFQKANQYFDAESKYEHAGDNYWGNFIEVESERRGLDAEKAYDRIINEDLVLENQAIDEIMLKIEERYGIVDNNTKLQILELAIEDLKNPKFANYSVHNFVNEFISKLV